MDLVSVVLEILEGRSLGAAVLELLVLMVPIWVALFLGVLVGWAWKPKWANLPGAFSEGSVVSSPPPPDSGRESIPARAISGQTLSPLVPALSEGSGNGKSSSEPHATISNYSLAKVKYEDSGLVNYVDLVHLCRLVEVKDGGPSWIHMMDRSTATMSYQAWRREPQTGPPQYRSRTVFEDASPELVRDFFWDDEFRLKWDNMLLSASTLEECPATGTMMVQWVRKFPFFCSDREYIIGRRIWESGRSYYCVTKGVPCTTVPRHNKPRRVDLYYSSWCVRAVESKRGDGQLTACEVLLFHHEDMGIPWEIAKLGVRQGMWGAVKKIEPGLRSYQQQRASEAPISCCAFMAQINTKVSADYLSSLDNDSSSSSESSEMANETRESKEKNQLGKNISKLLIFGGAVILACSLDRGLMTKAVIFGAGRRFGQIRR
ncbi:hypothetical protein SAY86_011836 [Trapa natans]|uniref:START domain-containing protein n=1 Tax=Trapa natans TaxID=22666 RepID=A0AAN7LW76_TRANT|nr:hypothetical protein SAY86_011836 [Trapa natans]